MPDKLTIILLGAPHVAVNGRALHFASVKATALLAFLATSGRLHDRAELAALLWPESDTKRARGALRYTLSLLKKALPDACLLIDRRQIGLDPAADWQADVVTLRRQLAAALAPGSDLTDPRDLAGVEQGIAAYRADFLHGFTLADCPDFNDWAFTQREALRRDLAAALKQVAAVYQQRRQWDTAVAYAHRWLDLDPLHEPAHCRLMQLYAAAQEWTAVQNQFQALTDLLQRELQCPPQPETVRLYDALLRQRETAVASARPLAGLTRDQRSRHVLLQKVRRFWVNPVLKPLQESQAYLSLQLAGANHQIDHPWADVLPDAAPAAAAADIVQAFRHADRALLLLGAPGAGKTTSLVALTRHLLAQAGDDAAAQMPVLLNLSSWAAEGGAVGAWVVEEMVAKYQIPRRLGRRWLAADRLLFLFDGLDEMPAAARAACIAALNEFRQTHGLPDMVVCCRLAAYEAAVQQQGVRLLLSGAVAIRPLTTQQIRQQLPRPLAELVFRDAALLDMAQSPLTLAMLRVALRGEPGRPAAAPPAAREDLFAQYVRGVLDRQYGKGHAPVAQDELTRQLSWLARQMERHNQSIFLIEQLQPSWLANGRWRWAYLLAAHALLPAILGLLVMGSFVELIRINPPYVEVNFLSHLAAWLGLESLPGRRLLVLFGLNLFAGLLSTVVTGLFFGWRRRRGDAARLNRRLGGVQLLGAAGVAGVSVMLPVAQTDTAVLALFLGGMAALGLALTFGGVSYGYSFRSEIRLRGPLKWSWRNGMLFGAGGMALSLAWSGVIWLRDPTAVSAWLNMLNMGLLFFLLGGLSDKQLQSEARPNEGMRIAGRNALLALMVTAVPAVVLTAVTVNFQSGVYTGIMVGILAGTVHGFNDLGKHAILRLLLWRRQQTSLRYARLLDWAADCLLLQKVGGGYTFRHRLLQAYFADRRA